MKKFLFLFIALSIGLSCKKPLCGCSPIEYHFALSIRNASGNDLLAPDATGGYKAGQITLYYKEGGNLKLVNSYVQTPFTYATETTKNLKFEYYQLQSPNLGQFRLAGNTEFYIRFGDAEPLSLSFDIEGTNAANVKIDNKPLNVALIAPGYPSVWTVTIP
ncbi:MAG: hypothetical protein V4594_17760 [Bacteroidota bacterium]